MKRREMLVAVGSGLVAPWLAASSPSLGWSSTRKTRLGIVSYCLGIRQRLGPSGSGQRGLADPLGLLEYCHRLGAGGIQVALGTRDEAYASQLRRQAEQYEMFVEAVMGLPRNPADVERFEAGVQTAKQSGALAIRVVMMPGRRYERFASADEYRRFSEEGLKSLELAEPVAARHRVRLAVENHKDHRIPERLAVLKHLSSEYVGACVDTGNSFALLEDPIEVVEAYAPWAFAVHLKDQGVREYEEGFLLGDVPLGEGFLDLPKMVGILRGANPQLAFSLELITRDPLQVPCLTDKYWATFEGVSGRDLARTLRTVRAGASAEPLPRVSQLSAEEQIAREQQNVDKSLSYARDHLGL